MLMVLALSILSMAYCFSWSLSLIITSALSFLTALSLFQASSWSSNIAFFSWDGAAAPLILLSCWTIFLCILVSKKTSPSKNSLFLAGNLSLMLILCAAFSSSSLLVFYILFEASLVPIFILILGWGAQPERFQASMTMFMYMIFTSLPFLVSIILWESSSGSTEFIFLSSMPQDAMIPAAWATLMVLAFLVKLPIYTLHSWLPKAHVEAPVAGSMVLAAVLLKLGGYGLMRVTPKILPALSCPLWALAVVFVLAGGITMGMACLTQVDVKTLIALSSVAHMALVCGGLFSSTSWGETGAYTIMIGHGFCSSSLFAGANMIYERSGSRSLLVNKGLYLLIPGFFFWWFVILAINMSVPPSVNIVGELMAFIGVVQASSFSCWLLFPLGFLPAAYSLMLFSKTMYGASLKKMLFNSPLQAKEHFVMVFHAFPLILLSFSLPLMIWG
uniref:NADH-ubiquinone oxidoreductase chain 4 n=1 Tax=Portunion sp. TaxID=2932407 RepID=A0A977XWF8_9CRUS|nr:NADH dehydrogenase subunit 4 [Portunion sp.]